MNENTKTRISTFIHIQYYDFEKKETVSGRTIQQMLLLEMM